MATTSEKSAILLHTNTAGMRKNATCSPLLATQAMQAACRQNNSAKGTGVNDKGCRDSEKCRDAEKRIRRDERKARTELGRRVYPWPHGGTRDLLGGHCTLYELIALRQLLLCLLLAACYSFSAGRQSCASHDRALRHACHC